MYAKTYKFECIKPLVVHTPMRGLTTIVKVVPRGDYMLTLKARGVLLDGSLEELREELYITRRAIQHVIDALWKLDKLPSLN